MHTGDGERSPNPRFHARSSRSVLFQSMPPELMSMLSKTPTMEHIFDTIRLVAPTEATVVIEGEPGTEKRAVANAIHQQSARQQGPFLMISCAALPDRQIESDLFGYETGPSTSDARPKRGQIELASGGTLFLDDIESLSLIMQAKLLRVLEEQSMQRIGGSQTIGADARFIIASSVPLKKLVAEGLMRSDFYYRMNVISIVLIPLRQKRSDIPRLVQDFLEGYRPAVEKQISRVSAHALDQLMNYDWPGNIRELQNVLEKAVILATSPIIEKLDLPESRISRDHKSDSPVLPLSEWIKQQEKQYLIERLQTFGGSIELTAKSCRVDTRTLYRKMRLYGLNRKTFRSKSSERVLSLGGSPRTLRRPAEKNKPS